MPATLKNPALPPLGLGLAAVVLGTIGLLLAPLPILGIPICGAAGMLGIAGVLGTMYSRNASLRQGVGGTFLALLAMGFNVAIYMAPSIYRERPDAEPNLHAVPDRPHAPPPAPHGPW